MVTAPIITPITEPREMYRLTAVTVRNVAVAISAATGTINAKLPSAVSMPRPPLNCRNTGQLWPTKTTSPADTSAAVVSITDLAMNTATTPFAMSRVKTTAADLTPPVRRTLDIPVRPLPYSLTSTPIFNCSSM